MEKEKGKEALYILISLSLSFSSHSFFIRRIKRKDNAFRLDYWSLHSREEQRGMMGDTPLARASHNGHFQTVKYLVEQGAEVDSVDIGDNTGLHWAAMRGHVEVVKYLLDNGADKTIQNKQEKIPIDLCQPCWSNSYKYTRAVLA